MAVSGRLSLGAKRGHINRPRIHHDRRVAPELVIPLDAPWRFHAGDDARFADPNFDDSGWPLVQPGEHRLLAASRLPPVSDGKDWLRLHLHVLNSTSSLAVSLLARNGTPYAVYANGNPIGASSNFSQTDPSPSRPFVIVLPHATDIVLAIHFVTRHGSSARNVPLEQIELGQRQGVGDRIDLERYRRFEEHPLVSVAIAIVFLGCVPFSIALLLAQRNHVEFLWLGLLCSMGGLVFLSDTILSSARFSWSGSITIFDFAYACETIFLIEFAFTMAEKRRRGSVRMVQAVLLVSAALYALGQLRPSVYSLADLADRISSVLTITLLAYLLLRAYFRGNKECGFFFFPAILIPLSTLKESLEYDYPKLLGPEWTGHLGGVGFTARQIASLLFIAGVLSVVFYRFIRVSKDEEIAAAELEAARTVQQLLIPPTAPATPGFSVESVYLPARQVGGDFFLVLPALEGSGDESLLAIMGDVSGKGLQAAMVVSTIIGGLRMQLSRQPGEVLAHLNRMLTGHVSGFATCCAVLIEPDGKMRIANAGNPSPYLNGEEVATLPGLPLGMVSEMMYEETTCLLEPGKQLTFVSDGVIEATSATGKELFGFDRTLEISGKSASAIAEASTLFGSGAPQADDITVLTVSRA